MSNIDSSSLIKSNGFLATVAPNFFFLFLVAPIFSPFVFGVTLYLNVFFALLDINFYRFLKNYLPNTKVALFGMLLILFSAVAMDPGLLIKLIMLSVTILYCAYAYIASYFYLYRYVRLAIIVAVLLHKYLWYSC